MGDKRRKRPSRGPTQAKLERLAAKNGSKPSGVQPPPGKTKTAGTEAEWLATLLHNAHAQINDLKRELIQAEQSGLNLAVAKGKLKARVLELEIAAGEKEMETIRSKHGIRVGTTIHKDDATGEVYHLEDATAKQPTAKKPAPVDETVDDDDDEEDDDDEDDDAPAGDDDPSESDEESAAPVAPVNA
ncbi:MAG TPA: hypothetical protein VMW94_06425 [Actinomycetes bacterium]|nr:hypothetical protein [Actinomycetes bacterium]